MASTIFHLSNDAKEGAGTLWPSLAAFGSVYDSNWVLASSLLESVAAAVLGDASFGKKLIEPALKSIEASAADEGSQSTSGDDDIQSTSQEQDVISIEVGNRFGKGESLSWRNANGSWEANGKGGRTFRRY